VSTPVKWDEVETCLKKKKADLLKFRCEKTLKRVDKMGDLFAPIEKLKQKLPKKWEL
jgi:bifunctional non-homologous end joining protein LigD